MATWPAGFPAAQINDYSVEAGDPNVRTDMDSGPARVRRRFTAVPDEISARFVLSSEQMVEFRTWWDADAAQGSAWFDMPVCDGRTAGFSTKEVRPKRPFKASQVNYDTWSVSLSIEVRSA